MTTFDSVVGQPSVLDMARAGNFRALSYWINTFLLPQGIHARVEDAKAGCVQILIESQHSAERDKIVQSICHQIWQLNSDVIQGVRIIAKAAGKSEILWKQSVRIVTPANQRRTTQSWRGHREGDAKQISFKTLRALLMAGTAIVSFVLSASLTYHSILPSSRVASRVSSVSQVPEVRPLSVRTGKETLPVISHNQVLNPSDPIVTLMFGKDLTTQTMGPHLPSLAPDFDIYREADFSTVSLDSPLTSGELSFTFNRLSSEGVDQVTVAADGDSQTENASKQAAVHYFGAGENTSPSRRPSIIDVKGQRIAYLAYDQANAENTALLKSQIQEDIKAIRTQVDWVVINYHTRAELDEVPSEWQVELSHFAIDEGADLVVGYHPERLQGAEIYKGRPIAYGLGSFIFGDQTESDFDTAVLKVSLKDRKMKVEFLPVQVRSFQPQVVEGEQGEAILNRIEEMSLSFNRPMTSPMIIYAPKTEPKQTTTVPTGKSFVQPSGSSKRLIEMPVFPGNIIQRNYLDQQLWPEIELPAEPTEDSLESEPEENIDAEPFIRQPFIDEPVSGSQERHSKVPAVPVSSFNLPYYSKPKDLQALNLAAVTQISNHKSIELPVFL